MTLLSQLPTCQNEDSSVMRSALQPLHQVALLPQRYSPCIQLLNKLKKIEYIHMSETVKRDGTLYYVMNLYMAPHSKSRIPTNQLKHDQQHSLTKDEVTAEDVMEMMRPTYRIARTLDDFVQLRTELFAQIQANHQYRRCVYCTKAMDYLLSGSPQPHVLMPWLHKQTKIKQKLTTFLNDVLELTLLCKPCAHGACQSEERIPAMIYQFLLLDVATPCPRAP